MDQLSAHLDRGWDLLSRGDARGARASARRALEIDTDSPEAHNLLGYAAAQEGDADEALEHYRQAMALDDGYIDPMLNAAEVLIHPLQDYDEAVALCDEVLEFAEGREEVADALLLKFDALLAREDLDGARRLLDDLPEGPYEGPMYPFLIGRAWYEVGEVDRADALLQDALKQDPQNADAHYYLGLVRDERRDWRGATLAFLESRELDLHAPPPPWSLPHEAFHKSVERALGGLDAELVRALEGALVLVSDFPGMEVVADGVDPRAAVLVEGLGDPAAALPAAVVRVFVYQRNIERLCGGVEQLEDEVAWQLTEEVRHLLHPDEAPAEAPSPTASPARSTTPAVVTASPSPEPEAPAKKKKPRKKA